MDDELSAPRHDQESVSARRGLQLPLTLLRILEQHSRVQTSEPDSTDFLFQATGMRFGNWFDRPAHYPPELVPIGQIELDGLVCGCVLHDPRLAGEMPLALFDPSIGRGDYLGVDTRRSLAALIGIQLNQSKGQNQTQARILAEELGFDPHDLPAEMPLGVRPRLAPGWKFAETADGLGVVAESRFFLPQQVYQTSIEDFAPLRFEQSIRSAGEALSQNAPASALWYVRNALVFTDNTEEQQQLIRLRNQAYRLLNRHILVDPGLANADKPI